LPDAGILRLPIAGDVETFDLWVPVEPLDHVRRKDDCARRDEHYGLVQTLAGCKGRLGAWPIGRTEPEGAIAIHDVLDRPCWIALGRHLPSTVNVREPALWPAFSQESKGHPSARCDAASLRCSPARLVRASLSTRDNQCDHEYTL